MTALFAVSANADDAVERPSGSRLLPSETVLFVRVADAYELRERWGDTALGKMANDEEMKPFLENIYGSAKDAFAEGMEEEELDIALDDLLILPQGEIWFALVSPEGSQPIPVLLIDVGAELETAEKLLDKAKSEAENDGIEIETEDFNDTELNIYKGVGPRNRDIAQFERDGIIVLAADLDLAKTILQRWDGEAVENDEGEPLPTLADNDHYKAIMSRCQGSAKERPQIAFYVDPIGIFKSANAGTTAGALSVGFISTLGLDGLHGVGGSLIMPEEEFDLITHLHVLLETPRSGVIEMVALGAGETNPEDFAPANAMNYATLHWKVDETYDAFDRLYGTFFSDQSIEEEIEERLSGPLEIDFKKEIIEQLEGRVTYLSWVEEPVRINGNTHLVGFKLKDAEAFRTTLATLIEKAPEESYETRSTGGIEFYHFSEDADAVAERAKEREERRRERAERDGREPPEERVSFEVRRPEGCVGIIGDYIIATDSLSLFQKAIECHDGTADRLVDTDDFVLVRKNIRTLAGKNGAPGMISYDRPEIGMKMWYDIANAASTREALADRENNEAFQVLNKALEDTPLPPFEVIKRYLAPGGAVMMNNESGFHYTGFSLKAVEEE